MELFPLRPRKTRMPTLSAPIQYCTTGKKKKKIKSIMTERRDKTVINCKEYHCFFEKLPTDKLRAKKSKGMRRNKTLF